MKSEDEIFRMSEFQEKERIFPKKMFEFQRKKRIFPKISDQIGQILAEK